MFTVGLFAWAQMKRSIGGKKIDRWENLHIDKMAPKSLENLENRIKFNFIGFDLHSRTDFRIIDDCLLLRQFSVNR